MSNLKFIEKTMELKVIFKGVIIGIVLLIMLSIILALFFSIFTVISLEKLSSILLISNYVIVIYIGFYTAKRLDNNGWLNGGMSGLLYMGIILLLGFIALPFSVIKLGIILFSGLIGGSLGGMIGINF